MISFWKILLLVVVIAGVWAAVSIYRRNQRQQEIKAGGAERPRMAHVNTVACRVCGTYVPERGAAKCARADCPV